MEITQRPRPWTDEALAEARREALTAIYGRYPGFDPGVLDMMEEDYEIRALARDCRAAYELVDQLKVTVKQQRGSDTATRKRLEAAKQLHERLTARLQFLDGRTPLPFPCGNVLPSDHAQTGRPAGGRLLDHITDDVLDTMFPPLIPDVVHGSK